jgi:hypothetical protein
MAALLMLFIFMCYHMSQHPPPPSMLQVPKPPSGLSSLANGYDHYISNIFTSSLLLKENANVHDANNQYRLDIQSKAKSNSKGMDMMNSDSGISIYDNYRPSKTLKDKDKDKVYCYSTKVSSTGHFDIICTEAKQEELVASPFETIKSTIIERVYHYAAIIDRGVTAFERFLMKYQSILLDHFH